MRINPRFIDKFMRGGLTFHALFVVGILILIILVIFIKGSRLHNPGVYLLLSGRYGKAGRHLSVHSRHYLPRPSFHRLCHALSGWELPYTLPNTRKNRPLPGSSASA